MAGSGRRMATMDGNEAAASVAHRVSASSTTLSFADAVDQAVRDNVSSRLGTASRCTW